MARIIYTIPKGINPVSPTQNTLAARIMRYRLDGFDGVIGNEEAVMTAEFKRRVKTWNRKDET